MYREDFQLTMYAYQSLCCLVPTAIAATAGTTITAAATLWTCSGLNIVFPFLVLIVGIYLFQLIVAVSCQFLHLFAHFIAVGSTTRRPHILEYLILGPVIIKKSTVTPGFLVFIQ